MIEMKKDPNTKKIEQDGINITRKTIIKYLADQGLDRIQILKVLNMTQDTANSFIDEIGTERLLAQASNHN